MALRIVKSFNKSRFRQHLVLYKGMNRLDIENQVDWHEDHVMIKAAFNLNIKGDSTTYEIKSLLISFKKDKQ